MSATVKVLLAFVAGVSLMCLCAAVGGFYLFRSGVWAVEQAANSSPEEIAQASSSIASYTLPDGFSKEPFVTDVAGFVMIGYTGDDNHSHIYLFQLPSYMKVDAVELERQFQEKAADNAEKYSRMSVVDQQPVMIMGQEVEAVISEGTNHDDQPYRQVTAIFQGRGGQALVTVSGPIATWDQSKVDSFLASLH